jgi:hypothetical protein
MYTPREPMALVDWRNYGVQMKENGSIFPYVFLRAIKRVLKNRDTKGGYRLILGYLVSSPVMYDKKLRKYNSKRQWKRILKVGF